MATKTKKVSKSEVVFDYKTIKSFEDACAKLGIDPTKMPVTTDILEEMAKPIIAAYKLLIIYKAINDGWKPNWGNSNEYKYFPWYEVLSSGFGFSDSGSYYLCTYASVGSRLCTNSREKALFIANTFGQEYKEYFLYQE